MPWHYSVVFKLFFFQPHDWVVYTKLMVSAGFSPCSSIRFRIISDSFLRPLARSHARRHAHTHTHTHTHKAFGNCWENNASMKVYIDSTSRNSLKIIEQFVYIVFCFTKCIRTLGKKYGIVTIFYMPLRGQLFLCLYINLEKYSIILL